MKKKPNPELIDKDNPEWTDEMFSKAKPFSALPARVKTKLKLVQLIQRKRNAQPQRKEPAARKLANDGRKW